MIEVRLASQLGYCSGVSQAIEQAIEYGDEPRTGMAYSLGTVAHNEHVVELLRNHGVQPISLDEMRDRSRVIITAHGAPPEIYERIEHQHCAFLDCTCPIVLKVQERVVELESHGYDVVIFGDPDHQEIKGLVGWARGKVKFVGDFNALFTLGQDHRSLGLGQRVGVVSQTTSVPEMYRDFIATLVGHHLDESPEVRIFNTICPIVATRVKDTRKLAGEVDMMFVVGSKESANTRNLERVCRQTITQARAPWAVNLVQNEDQVGKALSDWYVENDMSSPKVGVTAGTSTPIEVVEKVVAKLKYLGFAA